MSKAILAEHIENKFVIISPDMVKEGGCGNKEMIISQALAPPPHTHTRAWPSAPPVVATVVFFKYINLFCDKSAHFRNVINSLRLERPKFQIKFSEVFLDVH